MLVISLSSIPPRFDKLGPTLHSLLEQTARADRICLFIPEYYVRFPDWDGTLPEVPDGVEICRTEADFGPATKILPLARACRGQDCDILFVDDDRIYTPGWAETMLAAKAEHPDCCIATRGLMADGIAGTSPERALQPKPVIRPESRDPQYIWASVTYPLRRLVGGKTTVPPTRRRFSHSGYIDIFEGCGGVLVRPDFFDDAAFEIPPECWAVDDIWLSGMLARQGVPIWLVANTLSPTNTEAQKSAPLAEAVINGAARRASNRRAVQHLQEAYQIWL